MHRNAHQKKKLMTQYRRKRKSLDFPGKTELVDTIRAQEKSCEKRHKKENGYCNGTMSRERIGAV
ncbi:hypothetical protein D3Z47_21800 [Lachnospiraceae bacterium]|nr:hypothetical protein [Lachnospiraceae bacterium]